MVAGRESGAPGARATRQLLRLEVVEGIKAYILRNNLRSGDLLPTEPALCAALGASRSSVREAIRVLAALDIVTVRHGHGTYVGRLSLSALLESLTFRGLLSADGDLALLDLIEVRELFERGMADRLVGALGEEQISSLEELVDDMSKSGGKDGEGFVEADRAFHALLVAPLGNDLISQLSEVFWDVYAIVAPQLGVFTDEHEASTVASHRRIVNALRNRDAVEFSAALTEHYAPVRSRIAQVRATS